MNPVQIASQVSKKNRTLSSVYAKQKKAVLFVFLLLCMVPFLLTCLLGEINLNMTSEGNVLYFPESSKYTVVFETAYGTLSMDMDVAIACMLPTIVPPYYEEESIKAQAILLRTELLRFYESQEEKQEYTIYLEKLPYKKFYFTFMEQKEMYGESYPENLSTYRHAALETAGMYLRDADNEDMTEAGKIADVGWFLVSSGSTREGISCEKDYLSENYYNEKVISQKEYQKVLGDLYKECKKAAPAVNIQFVGEKEKMEFLVLLEDGTYDTLEVTAEKFCQSFNLLSPFIEEIVENDTEVIITVKGVGHGSGMSVFYANELAKEGRNYSEILNYFFTNIAIDKFE